MGCQHFERKATHFSAEKRLIVAMALDYKYYCPHCREIHTIKEETQNEGLS